MKRYGNLWHQVITFENLVNASRQAQKGKRFRENVLSFNYHLERNLHKLQSELQTKTYRPGTYRSFRIFDPKPRLISAAPYRDRVVHHALCNVIVPLMERSFIANSYANRKGYGTHRALQKFTDYARNSRYVLQCDIRKYFPSIDRAILKSIVRGKIKCADTLWLIDTIIDGGNAQDPVLDYFPGDDLLTPVQRLKGLPIGNLTSQFLANVYLNPFDHFVKEQLHCDRYLRYVDDFALFSDDKPQLAEAREQIEAYLATVRLKIHPVKSQLFETQYGANFVGFRIMPSQIRVRNDNLRRGRVRLKRLQRDYRHRRVPFITLIQRLQSWEAHLLHGDTYRLRCAIFKNLWFQHDTLQAIEAPVLLKCEQQKPLS
jgi:RNA-directed DNA polymerase